MEKQKRSLISRFFNGTYPDEESSRPGTLEIIQLHVNDLIPSKDNFYSIENIADLKLSIELYGVLQNLTVKPLDSGKYEIIAGHRRHKACAELVAEGKTEFEYLPCGVQSERDEIKERILLIITNSTTRELSDYEKMKQAEELQKHFEILKKRDNLPGRVRDLVAEALNTSATQIARMNAITKNLIPELTDEFKDGGLGLSAAYELSGLPEEKQKEAFSEYEEKGGLSLSDVKSIKEESRPIDETDEEEEPERDYDAEAWENFKNAGKTSQKDRPPRYEPKEYPETPAEIEADEPAPEIRDFADLSIEEKSVLVIKLLNQERFKAFGPGEDTRVFDFILEAIEFYGKNVSTQ